MASAERGSEPAREELIASGLLDPSAPDVRDREALIRFLMARGTTIDDLEHSRDLGMLAGTPVARVVRPGPRLSRRQVSWRTGIDDDLLVRMLSAAGLVADGIDNVSHTEADVLMARGFERLALLVGERAALDVYGEIGEAAARVAAAVVEAYDANVARPLRDDATTESEGDASTARALMEIALVLPDVARTLDTLLRHQLDQALRWLTEARGVTVDFTRGTRTAAG